MNDNSMKKLFRRFTGLSSQSKTSYGLPSSRNPSESLQMKEFEYLAKIINPKTCLKKTFYSISCSLFALKTNACWVELFLLKKNKLKVCGEHQGLRFLELDEKESLPAYVVIHKEPVIVTNPHTSVFLKSFRTSIKGISALTLREIKLTCTACVPLFVRDS